MRFSVDFNGVSHASRVRTLDQSASIICEGSLVGFFHFIGAVGRSLESALVLASVGVVLGSLERAEAFTHLVAGAVDGLEQHCELGD